MQQQPYPLGRFHAELAALEPRFAAALAQAEPDRLALWGGVVFPLVVLAALVAALPDRHRLAKQAAVTWADLAGETFLARHGGVLAQLEAVVDAVDAG